MLFIKRFFTFAFLSVLFMVVFFVGGLVVGGAICGATSARQHHAMSYEEGQKYGREAGREFGQKYFRVIFLGSGAVAVLISAGLSFSGAFPWCRANTPPPL